MNGIISNYLPVTCEVPQGLVFGPLFFSVYVNDRENLLQGGRVKLYADNTVMYHSG